MMVVEVEVWWCSDFVYIPVIKRTMWGSNTWVGTSMALTQPTPGILVV